MREDMPQVLIERPRYGWRRKMNRARQARAALREDAPGRMGVKRHRKENRTDTKGQNDHFGPLRRYLRRQVNRPWDKVYAEICANADRRNVAQDHLRLHIDDFIARPSLGRNGEMLWRGRPFPGDGRFWRRADLYVDPRDGIVKVVKPRRPNTRPKR